MFVPGADSRSLTRGPWTPGNERNFTIRTGVVLASRRNGNESESPVKKPRKPSGPAQRDQGSSRLGARRRNALENSNEAYATKHAEIIRVAAKLFAERGFESTNLNDIASEANMDRATLYYYFASKKDLLEAAVTGAGSDVIGEAKALMDSDADALTRLLGVTRCLVTAIHDRYPFSVLYFQDDVRHSLMPASVMSSLRADDATIVDFITEMVHDGRRDGTIRDDVEPELVVRVIYGAIAWTYRWLKPDCGLALDEVLSAFDAILASGVAPKKKVRRVAERR